MTKSFKSNEQTSAGVSTPVHLGSTKGRIIGIASSKNTSHHNKPVEIVSFNRQELAILLNIYGQKVSSGEWRDYAMDMLRDRAVFSIYRRSSERPQFIIEKDPKLRNRQGQYSVVGAEGRILKRGHDLKTVLRVLEGKIHLVK